MSMKKIGLAKITAAILSVGLLSACVSVLPEPADAPTIYRLSISDGDSVAKAANAVVVNIDLPVASKALSGMDIVVSPYGRRLTAAANASWAESVPHMVRDALIDKLSTSPTVIGVDSKGATLSTYRLNTDIRRFEAVFDNGEDAAPLGIVQYNITLVDSKTRALIGTKTIKVTRRAGARTVSAIVKTTDAINDEAMGMIAQWLETQLSAQPG